MSIVRGTGGYLSGAIANLISNGDFQILVYFKTPDSTQFDNFVSYSNAPTSAHISVDLNGGPLRGYCTQSATSQIESSLSVTNNTWHAAIVSATEASKLVTISTSAGHQTSATTWGTFTTPTTPIVYIFQAPSGSRPCIDGVKIGAIVLWSAQDSESNRAAILAGGNPYEYGTVLEAWVDNQGISKDGSDNLISWTGVISSTVLTPTGVVTVDDLDIAPHNFSVGSVLSLSDPTDPIVFSSLNNEVVANSFSDPISSITDQDSGYSYNITNQTGGDPNTVTFSAFPLISQQEISGGVVGPTLGSVTLVGTNTVSDPNEVATVATNTSLPLGYSSVVLSGSSNVEGTVGYGLNEVHGVTAADGWPVVFPTGSNTTVNADGTLQTDSEDLYFYMQNPVTYEWYAVRFLWTVSPESRMLYGFKQSLRLLLRSNLRLNLKTSLRA